MPHWDEATGLVCKPYCPAAEEILETAPKVIPCSLNLVTGYSVFKPKDHILHLPHTLKTVFYKLVGTPDAFFKMAKTDEFSQIATPPFIGWNPEQEKPLFLNWPPINDPEVMKASLHTASQLRLPLFALSVRILIPGIREELGLDRDFNK